jgi:hypothetical protein
LNLKWRARAKRMMRRSTWLETRHENVSVKQISTWFETSRGLDLTWSTPPMLIFKPSASDTKGEMDIHNIITTKCPY